MATTHHPRRSDTRRRIQDVALELFAEHGYEKTSLREIAERLDVTKAALYYHFKTKEDILVSVADDLVRPMDELIAWAGSQPRTLATKQEVLRRYSDALWGASELFRFVQENQASVRDLSIGESFKTRMTAMSRLLSTPEASLSAQVRCMTALFSLHAGIFAIERIEGDIEEKRSAVLEVALDLVAQAEAGSVPGPAR
jgi:AcrR family transcriptional regulator